MDIPELDCPTYANVALAKAACSGTFLMWGETFNSTTGVIRNSFAEGEQAQYGPYYCETCFDGFEGYGYVGSDETLPDQVNDVCHQDTYCSTTCNWKIFENVEDTSCGGLQRYCEESGSGWLIYAKAFENFPGDIICSGGCTSELLGIVETEYGQQAIALPGHAADLRSWPMIFMWAMIGAMFGAASVIDLRLYKGETKLWFARFVFCLLGYVDLEGNRKPFWSQILVNPCSCLCDKSFILSCCCCCFKCSRNRDDQRNDDNEEEEENEKALDRIGFLSLLILSLGVALLFGDGEPWDQTCFFDAVPASETEIGYDKALPHAFHDLFFGQPGPVGVSDTDPSLRIFDKEWWVAELAIVMYEMAQQLLAYHLVAAGYLRQRTTLYLIVINSSIFMVCCWSLYWGSIVWGQVWEGWFIGFVLAILFTPVFNAMAYGLAICIAGCGWLPDPSKAGSSRGEGEDSKQQRNSTSSPPKNDEHDDTIAEKEYFKVVIPQGMRPGQQIKVHMGVASVESPLVVIPDREHWQSEKNVDMNGKSVEQSFFYVETKPSPPAEGSSSSVDMAEELPNGGDTQV